MPTTRLNPSSVNTFSEPFSYFLVSDVFTTSESTKILNWLKSFKDWHLVKTGLYEQYEFSLNDINPPNPLSFLKEGQLIDELRSLFIDYLGIKLSNRAEISAHKLGPGQTIRLHNDYFPEGETNRIVIQINEAFEWDMGGVLSCYLIARTLAILTRS